MAENLREAMMGGGGDSDEDDISNMRLPTLTTKYRDTTVGKLLSESLDELVAQNKISSGLYDKVLCQFDRSVINALGHRLTSRVTFKAAKLHTYRYLDGIWTFVLDHVEFREFNCFANVNQMKILAFDAKTPVPRSRSSAKKRYRGSQAQLPSQAVTK